MTCAEGMVCKDFNPYYSQCVAMEPTPGSIAEYSQCGGINYEGSGTCVVGTVCKDWNPYYSQCVAKEYL